MSKPPTAVTQRPNPNPLSHVSARSAWAKGPPQSVSSASSPRSQSPAPQNQQTQSQQTRPQSPVVVPASQTPFTHSRRSSALSGPAVAIGVGPNVARAPAAKNASSVTFGSIDQPLAPIAPSPAVPPQLSTELPSSSSSKVKTFGSIPSTGIANVNGSNGLPTPQVSLPTSTMSSTPSSAAPTPPPTSGANTPPTSTASSGPAAKLRTKLDMKKFFQGTGASSLPAVQPSPAPPSVNPPAPQHASSFQPQSTPSPHQQAGQNSSTSTFAPGSPYTVPRPLSSSHGQPPPGNGGPGPIPRSPSFQRQMSNGSPAPRSPRMGTIPPSMVGNVIQGAPTPPNGGAGTPAAGPPMALPHTQHQQPMGIVPGMPWPPYYYVPAEHQYMGQPPFGQPFYPGPQGQHLPPPPPHQPHPGHHPQHLPHQHHPQPSHAPHLQSHPHPPHSPHLSNVPGPMQPTGVNSPRSIPPPLTSPPPASPSVPSPSTRLSGGASAFVPRRPIVIKDSSGKEIDLQRHKRDSSIITGVSGVTTGTPSPAGGASPVPEKKKPPVTVRLESEEAKKARLEAERRKEEEEKEKLRKEEEEKERIKREEEERKRKAEEEERRKKEEEERLKREEEERIRKEEEARVRKLEEERLRKEEEERLKKELEEQLRKQQEERKQKEAEERERLKLEEERKEKERLEREAQEKARLEEEAAAAAAAAAEIERLQKLKEREEAERKRLAELEKMSSTLSPLPTPPTPNTPALRTDRRRPVPGPLDLSNANRPGIPQPLPSALATARIISNLDEISYPEGIKSPKIELNQGAKEGKFKYDRDFLLQFMIVCKEKPDNLPPLDAIGLDPSEGIGAHPMQRGHSKQRSLSQNVPATGARSQVGLGIGIGGPFNKQSFRMDEFSKPGASGMRNVTGPASTVPFPGKPGLVRTPSLGGPNGMPTLGDRHRGPRGSKSGRSRGGENRTNSTASFTQPPSLGAGLEPVAPLESTANRWTASSVGSLARRGAQSDENAPELVDRKVKSLLNKLTMEKFDSISDQIIDWANKSEKESDGRTLMRVIRLVFEKATDEAAWSEMYARLCRKMHEKISSNVRDESIKTSEGQPFAGGQLFRKYLLNRCQEDFERGWQMKVTAEAAAAAKADDDRKVVPKEGEEALYSEEYYVAQRAKRQGLGLVKFIGELFKLQMLTERIMHECIKKLLSNVDNPAEEEIESLCKLLTTVGQQLDNPKAKARMDVYFQRMKELSASPKIASRMQYMLMDVIELRERRWQSRNLIVAPTTIAAVHEQAAKEKIAAEKQAAMSHALPMSRGGSRRGEHSRSEFGADGWTTAVGAAASRPPAKAGDLANFGKISKEGSQPSFRPGSAAFKKEVKRESTSLSRTASNSNMFASLGDSQVEPALSRGSQPPSRKPSADFSQTGIPTDGSVPGRKRLQLRPRSIPLLNAENANEISTGTSTPDDRSTSGLEDGEIREELAESIELPPMTVAEAERKIKEDVKELFSIRNLEEALEYFRTLPSMHHPLLVDKIITQVMDMKEKDAEFAASFFEDISEVNLCSVTDFEEGFSGTVEMLEDLSVDVPAAYRLMAIVLIGAKLPREAVERLGEKISVDGELLKPPKEKLLAQYDKLLSS